MLCWGNRSSAGVELAPLEQRGAVCPALWLLLKIPVTPEIPSLSVLLLDSDARGDLSGLCRQLRGPPGRPPTHRTADAGPLPTGPAGFALSRGGGCLASARLIKRTLAPGGARPANMSLPGAGPVQATERLLAGARPQPPPPAPPTPAPGAAPAPGLPAPQNLSSTGGQASAPSVTRRGHLPPSRSPSSRAAHGPSVARALGSRLSGSDQPLFPARRVLRV